MPGMFGSSGDMTGAPVNVPISASKPAWAGNIPAQVSQPGQLYGLSSNLAGGGFGGPGGQSALYSWLNNIYKTPAAPKPATKTTPKPKVVPKVAPVGPTAAPAPKRPSSLGHNAR